MPHLHFWLPPTEVIVNETQPAMIEAVTIQRMSWDHFHVEYQVEWWDAEGKKEEVVTQYNVRSTVEPIHLLPGFDEHPPADYG